MIYDAIRSTSECLCFHHLALFEPYRFASCFGTGARPYILIEINVTVPKALDSVDVGCKTNAFEVIYVVPMYLAKQWLAKYRQDEHA